MVEHKSNAETIETNPNDHVPASSQLSEPMPSNQGRRPLLIVLAVVLLLAAVGIGGLGSKYLLTTTNAPSLVSTSSGEDGNKTVTQEESDIAAVAAKVGPSVVSITSSIRTSSFYGSEQAAGTGIIVSKDGYVMTNYHVIDGGTNISVIDSEGNEYDDVSVIGRDPLNDVAYLKINSNDTFTPVEIGDSSTVRIGQQVVAIGNALGQYQNTVTSGILSGTGRPITASSSDGRSESLTDLLQTDASINEGNSGGPLLNLAGQVIGINTAIADDANGIGFAIPINGEKGILAGIFETGKISRAYLGVNYVGITPDVAQQNKLPVKQGAYVHSDNSSSPIDSDGPASKAGVKDGDVIQKVGDQTIGKQGGLSTILGEYRPGDKVTLTILRGDKTVTVDVVLGKYNAS